MKNILSFFLICLMSTLTAQTNVMDTTKMEELSSAEVIAKKRNVVYRLDKKIIDAAGYSSTTGGSAIDVLEHTPSIRIDAEGELTFRGSSGFKVFIDGKPSTLNGSAALEQIPASQIDNIEVMTSPSAKHSPDGTVGIINVITKKQKINGWSGLLNASASTVESLSFDFLLTHKKGPLSWNLGGNAFKRYRKSDFDQTKEITLKDTLTTTRSVGKRVRYVDNYSGKTGFEYAFSKTRLTADVEAGYRGFNRGGELNYTDTYQNGQTAFQETFHYRGADHVDLHEWFVKASAGFHHQFEKQGHTLEGSYFIMYGGDALEYFQTDLYDLSNKQIQGHRAWEDEFRWTSQARLDYVLPLKNEGKLELGYLYDSYLEDGDYTIQLFDTPTGQFTYRDDLGAAFLFRRDIHALYSMWSKRIEKFSYQLGLRSEYTHQVLGGSVAWAAHTENRMEFFPSVHLGYQLTEKSRTNLAYSRRTTRPELFFMEPYVVYVDHYTAQTGNPYIRPEYTNSFEGGYQQSVGPHSVAGTLFHRSRKDKIERIRTPYHTGVTLDSMANVGNDYATGAELTSNWLLKPWWTVDINASLYYYTIKNNYTTGKEESWNWQVNLSNSFNVTKNTRLQVDGNYVGPSVNTQGQTDEFYYINLSLRHQLMNRKLTVSLSAIDVLATAKYNNTQTTTGLQSVTNIVPRAPLVTIGLSYSFNNFAKKKAAETTSHDLFEGTNR